MTDTEQYKEYITEWIFIGIIIYVTIIVFIVIARHCILRRLLCCTSENGLHCTYIRNSWANLSICPTCNMRQCMKNVFCCRRKHTLHEPSCFENLPSFKLRCYKPECDIITCICCDFYIENERPHQEIFVVSKQFENESLSKLYERNLGIC